MKNFIVAALWYFTVFAVCTPEVIEVSSRVGRSVSISCFGEWTVGDEREIDTLYFCRTNCSSQSVLLQTGTKNTTGTREGRYSIRIREDGAPTVTVEELGFRDAGEYVCGAESSSGASYQRVQLQIYDAPTVPAVTLPVTNVTLETDGVEPPPHASSPRFPPSRATFTLTSPGEKKKLRRAISLTETTVVIIVSGSLALVVCAAIPLIFYRHWQTNSAQSGLTENSDEGDLCEDDADASSLPAAVGMTALQQEELPPEQNLRYSNIYQGLDPKSLDCV